MQEDLTKNSITPLPQPPYSLDVLLAPKNENPLEGKQFQISRKGERGENNTTYKF
jgi:hypothetical protein